MPETYDKIFRQVALKGGLLVVDDAGTLEANYTNPTIGQAQMLTKSVIFPQAAVQDAILAAGDRIVRACGSNPMCPYRKDFADVTNSLASGVQLPQTSASGAPIIGVIGAVRDAATGHELEFADDGRQEIDDVNSITLKSTPYIYYTDGVRIWHSVSGVICDVVVWEHEAERAWMEATPTRGDANFSEDLYEALVNGSLGELFRGSFNADQAPIFNKKFEISLNEIKTYGRVMNNDQT